MKEIFASRLDKCWAIKSEGFFSLTLVTDRDEAWLIVDLDEDAPWDVTMRGDGAPGGSVVKIGSCWYVWGNPIRSCSEGWLLSWSAKTVCGADTAAPDSLSNTKLNLKWITEFQIDVERAYGVTRKRRSRYE